MVKVGWAPEKGGGKGGGKEADRCRRHVSRQCIPWVLKILRGGCRRPRVHRGLWLGVVEDDLSGERGEIGKAGIGRVRGHGLLHCACGLKYQV